MSNPRKITVDLDLLNNRILNVSAIKSPVFSTDFGGGLRVPSKLDIEAPSADQNPGRVIVHTGDKGILDLYTGDYNKEALSAVNSIRLTSTALKGERFDSHSHYTLKVRDLITVKGNREAAIATLDTVNEKLASTFKNTELEVKETEKNTIENRLSKVVTSKEIAGDIKIGAGTGAISADVAVGTAALPNLELATAPGESVDSILHDDATYHFYINATASQSTAKLDNLLITSRVIQQGKTSFTNKTQNDIRADKKLDVYTPDLYIGTKKGNVKFIESTGDVSSITVDNETVTTELISQTKSTLAGHTYITAKPEGKSYLEATVATINVGKTSTSQNSENLLDSSITDINVLSTNINEQASSSYTLEAPKTFKITAGYGAQTKTLLESINISKDGPQNNRTSLNIDNITSNDLKGTQTLQGKFELNVNKTGGNTDNHAQVVAKDIEVLVEDNNLTVSNTTEIAAGKGKAIKIAAGAAGSYLYMGQSEYGTKPEVGVQGVHISNDGKESKISAQKMSAAEVHVQEGGSVDIDSPVAISKPVRFNGGDSGNIIQATEAENLKIETAGGRATITGKDITIHSEYGDLLTTDASKETSTLNVSHGTFDQQLISSKSTQLKTSTAIDGSTCITGTSLNVTATSSNLTSKQIAIGSQATVTSKDTVNVATKTINIDDTSNTAEAEVYDGTTTIKSDNLDIDARQFSLSSTGHTKDILTWGATSSDSKLNVNSATVDASTSLVGAVKVDIKPAKSFVVTTYNAGEAIETEAGSIAYSGNEGLVINESTTLHLDSKKQTFALGSNTVQKYGATNKVVARVDADGSKISADSIKALTKLEASALTATGDVQLASPTVTSGGITFKGSAPSLTTDGKLTITGNNGVLIHNTNNTADKVEILADSSEAKLDNITATLNLTSNTKTTLTGTHVAFDGNALEVDDSVADVSNLLDLHAPDSAVGIQAEKVAVRRKTANSTFSVGESDNPFESISDYANSITQAASSIDYHTTGETPKANKAIGSYMSINSNVDGTSTIRSSHVDTNTTNVSNKLTVGAASIYWDANTNSLVVSV